MKTIELTYEEAAHIKLLCHKDMAEWNEFQKTRNLHPYERDSTKWHIGLSKSILEKL